MIKSYFETEKRAASIFLAFGIVACSIASAFFISAKPPFYMGLALAFGAIGIYEIIVGVGLVRNSDFQAIDMQKLLGADPQEFRRQESERLEKLLHNMRYYKIFGGFLLLTGFFLITFHKTENFWQGLGCSLEIQGVAINMFYFLTERRAKKYAAYVDDLVQEGK